MPLKELHTIITNQQTVRTSRLGPLIHKLEENYRGSREIHTEEE